VAPVEVRVLGIPQSPSPGDEGGANAGEGAKCSSLARVYFLHRRIARIASRIKAEEVSLGNKLVVEGQDRSKFFVIAQAQVEVLSKGVHGTDLRIALLTEGETSARRSWSPTSGPAVADDAGFRGVAVGHAN
jgi:hypothetical protein